VESRGAGLTAEADRLLGARVRVRAGTDLAFDHADTTYHAVTDDGLAGAPLATVMARRERIGAFAAGDWWATPRVRLAGAVRFDGIGDDARPSMDGRVWRSAWSPRLGATVRLGPMNDAPVSAFVQASRAFKAPTIDQLVDPRPFDDFQGGTLVLSNPRLRPQRAANLEAGVSRHGARTRFTAAVYRMAVEDEIDFDPATFRYANIGSSVHGGIELDARFLEGRAVSPRLSYAWTRVRLRGADAAGGQLKNIPEHTVRAGVTARLPGGVAMEMTGEAMAGRFLDDDGASPLESALLVDARLQRRFGRVRARLDATNLTGRSWEAVGYALPDFEGGVVPYVFPGMGRAVRAGLDVIF
jgi:outer membrane receptor protein involved in Fe transport